MTRTLRRVWNRLLGSISGQRREGDLAEELDSHIRLLAEENVRRGVPPEEAHRRAKLQFGSVESTKESYRDQRGLPALDTTVQDLHYAFRGIRKNPGFVTVAILSLAIGIGANTAIFSLVNAVLLQPLAYKEPQRLFAVGELRPHRFGQRPLPVNPVHARAWAKECPSLEQVALMRSNRADVATGGEPASFRRHQRRERAVRDLPPPRTRPGGAFAVQLLWPGEPNPVGRRFIGEDDKPKTLVGVVAEVRAVLDRDPPPMAYYPYWQVVPGRGALVVRTTGRPANCRGRPSRRASQRGYATADPDHPHHGGGGRSFDSPA